MERACGRRTHARVDFQHAFGTAPGWGIAARQSGALKQPWLRAAIWTVDLFDPPRHFSWRSRTGTIETVASHLLEDRDHATVATFAIQHEGPGAGVIALLTGPLTRRYLDRELSGLKTRTEQLANPSPS
jgi:hypothetical protein